MADCGHPDLTAFARLDGLGLEPVGQRLELIASFSRAESPNPISGADAMVAKGSPRDNVVRRLAYEPLGWRPTMLEVLVRRYRCIGCGHVWRQDTTASAEPRGKLAGRHRRPRDLPTSYSTREAAGSG